jgi:hypothetical protein
MSPVVVGNRIIVAGKRGVVYLLGAGLGGIGGQVGELGGCAAFGGAAVAGNVVVLPCDGGIRAIEVGPGGGTGLRWRWQLPGVAGSPVIAGADVYSLDRGGGSLDVVALSSGRVLGSIRVGAVTRFATPTPGDGLVFVGTTSGVVAIGAA